MRYRGPIGSRLLEADSNRRGCDMPRFLECWMHCANVEHSASVGNFRPGCLLQMPRTRPSPRLQATLQAVFL